MRASLLIVTLAGCAAAGGSAQEELARELSGRAAGAAQACVDGSQSGSLQAVDRGTVVLRSSDAVWVNRLAVSCPGLGPMGTLIVERFSGRYCRGDHFRAIEAGASTPGPICVLGDFTPYREPR